MNLNNLVLQYAKANLEIDGSYRLSIPPGSKVTAQTTVKGVCGFVIPICGRAKFTVCNEEYELKRGVILHAGSGMDLSKEVIGDKNWEFILLHYRVLGEERTKESLMDMNYTMKVFPDQHEEIIKILDAILSLQKEFGTKHVLKNKILLYELIAKIFSFSEVRQSAEPKDKIEEVLGYIHEHLEENLSVSEIAENFQWNAKQFNYSFQKRVGLSPKKYIMTTQIKRAKELLLESDLPIIEIANQVGYEDALHFSRIFKQNTGVSPSLFRRQVEKNPY
ncbi:helix-turn-helix domain-containing protein [Konateibacter massiliensis]|uniref:helix-turn-helix domain-containing protein n=1 Tax=Konateibacter massiliensis TaxID=2002841 RepID=UPI000C147380|nr:AraC family transcriptional regulator [Konateibacter massiliensis]